MLFVELRFLVFLAAFFLVYWSFRKARSRNCLILLGSYFFYGSWDWRFLGLIILSTAIDYVCAISIEDAKSERARRIWLTVSLVFNLGILGFFKYFNFFADQLISLVGYFGGELNYTTINIILPIGISFYTLQTMSYTLDVFTKRCKAERNPVTVAAYVAFFPQLVAGPILRAHEFMPQLQTVRRWADVSVQACLILFLSGLFKKAVIADNIGIYVDMIYADPGSYSYLTVLGALAGFSVQIYCDFSGYSDMAIASAGLLGFHLQRNFYMPLQATSITQYRGGWHISLSHWIRDYIYIPMGGGRKGKLVLYRNLFVANLISGIWHGAAWTFIAWGAYQGTLVVIHRTWHNFMAKHEIHIPFRSYLGWFTTFCMIMASNTLFRANQIADSMTIFSVLSGVQQAGTLVAPLNPMLVAAPFFVAQWAYNKFEIQNRVAILQPAAFAVFYGVAVILVFALRSEDVREFYYFQF